MSPFDKKREDPKTLRHMLNRLQSLGYVVTSTRWSRGASAWQIGLATGQKLLYEENGKVRLAHFNEIAASSSFSIFRDRRISLLVP